MLTYSLKRPLQIPLLSNIWEGYKLSFLEPPATPKEKPQPFHKGYLSLTLSKFPLVRNGIGYKGAGLIFTLVLKISALIPVKELSRAKLRLSGVLNPRERRRFTASMLIDVLNTVTRCSFIDETVIVSSDPIVHRMAESFNASLLFDGGNGLNEALRDALEWCMGKGFDEAPVKPPIGSWNASTPPTGWV